MRSDTDLCALDRDVATKVMGWRVEIAHSTKPVWKWQSPDGLFHDSLPPFSADTDAGWGAMRMVVERMAERGFMLTISQPSAYVRTTSGGISGAWWACFVQPWEPDKRSVPSPSLPLAVCRAALAALGASDA